MVTTEAASPAAAAPAMDAMAVIKASAAEAQLPAKWAQLSGAALDAEVASYRSLIKSAAAQLKELGVEDVDAVIEADAVAPADAGGQTAEQLEALLKDIDPSEWEVPPHCVPIHANVVTYEWSKLYNHTKFDVIMMDPPWQLATANPTRGVALGYSQLCDDLISGLPVPQLQEKGFIFIWLINAKYKFTLDLFKKWGYRLVDEIVWVKQTVNRRMAKSHGYYLQHAKEVCLVGVKGEGIPYARSPGFRRDVIVSERRGQSQKPEEIYEMIEDLVPNGKYLEVFGRKNNLHDFWVTVGNEVTGTGPPEEDVAAIREKGRAEGATYGKTGAGPR